MLVILDTDHLSILLAYRIVGVHVFLMGCRRAAYTTKDDRLEAYPTHSRP